MARGKIAKTIIGGTDNLKWRGLLPAAQMRFPAGLTTVRFVLRVHCVVATHCTYSARQQPTVQLYPARDIILTQRLRPTAWSLPTAGLTHSANVPKCWTPMLTHC